MQYIKEHPIAILNKVSSFAIILAVPVFRALLFSGASIENWISGVWIDLLSLLFILLMATLVWFFNLYCLDKKGVYEFKGIFFIKKTFYPIEKTTQISFEAPWYLKVLRARRIRIETPAGSKFSSDVEIVVSKKYERMFFESVVKADHDREYIKGNFLSQVGLALLSSNGITGVIFLAALISHAGKIIGSELERMFVENVTQTARNLAIGIPPIATDISVIIAAGWIFSFILNLLRYGRFSVLRSGDKLKIENGNRIGRWFYLISIDKINFIEVKQTLITKLLRFYTVNMNAIGYGKSKNEKPILIPIYRRDKAMISLRRLLPKFKFSANKYKPARKNFKRFIWWPVVIIIILSALTVLGVMLFSEFSSLIMFCFLMFCILDAAFLITKILAYFHTGVCFKDDMFTVSYTKRFSFYKVCFPKQKLMKATLRQSLFQKRAGCCTVILYTLNEKRSRHLIPNLNLSDAEKFLNENRSIQSQSNAIF